MKNKGMTIIEILGVLLLLSLTFTLVIPVIQQVLASSRKTKLENSFKSLGREIQANNVSKSAQYTMQNGEIFPAVEFSGNLTGTGTIVVDDNNNVEIKVDAEGYCVYKSFFSSNIKATLGRCDEIELSDYELLTYKGLITNHSITIVADFSGREAEYYFQLNGGEWIPNENLEQNYYTFEELTHNTAYELRAKAINSEGATAVSEPLLIMTANVVNPTLSYRSTGSNKLGVFDFDFINSDYIYRYKLNDGEWHIATNAVAELGLVHNNTNLVAEILDNEGNTMVAVNRTIDYSGDTDTPRLATESRQSGTVSNKYFLIDFGNLDPFFTYRYKVNDGAYVTSTANAEALIPSNNSTIVAEVIDPAGEVMKTNTMSSAYYDDTQYTITLVQGANGTISSNKARAKVGDSVTITTTPNATYTINTLTCTGCATTNIAPSGNSSSVRNVNITMPRSNVTITVTWKLDRIYYVNTSGAATSTIGSGFTVGKANIGTGSVEYGSWADSGYWAFQSNQATSWRTNSKVNLTNINYIYFDYYRWGAYYSWSADGTFRVLIDDYTSGWCGGGYTPRDSWNTASINVSGYTGDHYIVIEACNSGVRIKNMYGRG